MAVQHRQVPKEGNKDVAATGTPVQIVATETWVTSFMMTPKGANSGANIYVGFSSATADKTNDNHVILQEQDTYNIKPDLDRNMQQEFDLSTIWIDCDTNGDGVVFQYVQAQGNS